MSISIKERSLEEKLLWDAFAALALRVGKTERQVANQAIAIKNIGDLNRALQTNAALKSQAAQQQATEHLYAPLRSDTRAVVDLAAFARRLLNPQDLGHAVTLEVRNAARRALGLPEVKEYDL